MLKKDNLTLLLLVGMVYVSNLNEFIMSVLFPGTGSQYEQTGFSLEFFVGFLFIFISLTFLTNTVLYQTLSGSASKALIIFVLMLLSMSISIYFHVDKFQELKQLISLIAMFLYFFIGKGFAQSYGEYFSRRLWKFLVPLPFIILLFYLFFVVTNRIEYADIFTLYRGRSIMEGLKPQIQGGFRSDEIASYVGLTVIFLLYCLHAADNKKSRKFILLILGLTLAFLIVLFSMGAFLAIGAVFGLYMIQKRGTAGIAKGVIVCLVAGVFFGLLFPSGLEVLKDKVIEKTLDLSPGEGGRRGLRYGLLWKTAVNNPVLGVGPQELLDVVPSGPWLDKISKYPHQNILGIAAGYGLFAATFYTLFIFSIIWTGTHALCRWDTERSPTNEKMRYLLFMAVASFLYLQMHGLFLDTWQIKQTYLWAGVTVGLVQRLQLNYGRQAVQRAFYVTIERLPRARCKLR
jgi:hypothetical protein